MQKIKVSQMTALRFYWREYGKVMRFHWLIPLFAIIAKLLTWRVPALLMAGMISRLQNGESINYVKTILIAMSLAFLGELIMRIAWFYGNKLQSKTVSNIYAHSMENIIEKSTEFHGSSFAGSNANKIMKLADGSEYMHDTIADRVPDLLSVLIFAIYILGLAGAPSIIAIFASFAIFMFVISPLIKKYNQLQVERNELESKRTGSLIDAITNISPVKSFAREQEEVSGFTEVANTASRAAEESWQHWNSRISTSTTVFYVGIAFLPLMLHLYLTGASDAGAIFITFYALDMLASRIWGITNIWDRSSSTLTRAAEGLELLAVPNAVADLPDAKTIVVDKGVIELRDASFAYEGGEKLYDELCLKIQSGEKLGLVGPSGGGKTTLAKLIMRFMDIDSGELLIDGQSISEVTQSSLRQNISYIPQEPALFHRTLRENILYGNPDASDKEMIAASKKAHAHEFIKDLPQGYDTLVGERGIKLSGGQRQRVAIARSFLKDAPILVLDEATSALDSESEKFIQDALLKLMKGKTVISIAHRLSTLQIMDRLIVIENGEITEEGSHKDLVALGGTYNRLWKHQSGDYI